MSDNSYSTISATGPDAFEFLQAQLASDINVVKGENSQRSAWCNPKGRVICMPTVAAVEDGYALSMPSNLIDLVVQRMTLFRFRSKVDLAVQNGGLASDDSPLERLRAGIPEIELAQSEKFTPHMLNLDLLDIVSLDKGCYPGQEIVARTHYRGASKRRCLRFESSKPVTAGDKVSNGDREIGEVVNAIGTDLLAVVPVSEAGGELLVNGIKLQNIPLPYL